MNISTVLVTGAGGFAGTLLVKKLINSGVKVKALDTFWYGNHLEPHKNLEIIKADLRNDLSLIILDQVDAVIHLACISNDPSFELDTEFSNSINIQASKKFIDLCRQSKIKRFIFASSSSVYGVKSEELVTEELSLDPLTPYSVSKVEIENYLLKIKNEFDIVILRPATLYGCSPRLRLDLVSNILTAQAFFENKITVFGGSQQRPQLYIQKMLEAYELCLFEKTLFKSEIYNVGEKNFSVDEIATTVKSLFSKDIKIEHLPSSDIRSYKICSTKFEKKFNLQLHSNLKTGLSELITEFQKKPNMSWTSPEYHNVKNLKMQLSEAGAGLGN